MDSMAKAEATKWNLTSRELETLYTGINKFCVANGISNKVTPTQSPQSTSSNDTSNINNALDFLFQSNQQIFESVPISTSTLAQLPQLQLEEDFFPWDDIIEGEPIKLDDL